MTPLSTANCCLVCICISFNFLCLTCGYLSATEHMARDGRQNKQTDARSCEQRDSSYRTRRHERNLNMNIEKNLMQYCSNILAIKKIQIHTLFFL